MVLGETTQSAEEADGGTGPSEEKYGEAISLASTEAEKQKIYERYILGKPEDIVSKLAVESVLRTAVLSLIASGFVRTANQLTGFFEKSFYGHQYQHDWGMQVKLADTIELLKRYEFVQQVGDKLEPTRLGKRVSELYLDPDTAQQIIDDLKQTSAEADDFTFLFIVASTGELSPHLRLAKADSAWLELELAERKHLLPHEPPGEWDPQYANHASHFKTTMMLYEWTNEVSDEYLMDKYNIRPGEIRNKLASSDWVLFASSEIARLLGLKQLISPLNKVRLRVKHGIRVDLLPLVKLRGIGRYRARKLYRAGIKNLVDIKTVDKQKIASLLGTQIAESVKKQVT